MPGSGRGALLLKGVFIPWLFFRAIREVRIRREIEPLIGYVPTLILGALTTAASFIFADFLPLLPSIAGPSSSPPPWLRSSPAFCC